MKRRFSRLMLFVLIATLLGGMACLTRVVWQADRRWQLVEQEAVRDKNISIALWRLDSLLAPLLARQATLPVREFQLDQSTFDVPSVVPQGSDPFVLFKFHWPEALTEKAIFDLHITASVSKGAIDWSDLRSLVARSTWQELQARLPRDLVPTSPKLLAEYDRLNSNSDAAMVIGNSVYQNGLVNPVISNNQAPTNNSYPINNQEQWNDLQQRNYRYQAQGAQQIKSQSETTLLPASAEADTGVCKPLWVADWLIMARQVTVNSRHAIQGCRLDWFKLRDELLIEIHDLLPQAELVPVVEDAAYTQHMLAGLPVRLHLPTLAVPSVRWSPLIVAVAGGWIALLTVAGGLSMITFGAIHFAEKRASFVSSVTHELRTPLTTFQMYSEMLARGIVPQESTQEYLNTLCVESNRLCNLIDNVLTFARLERGGHKVQHQKIDVGSLLDRIGERLLRRVEIAGMQLEIVASPECRQVSLHTDPAFVEQILFNLVDNACKYASQSEDKRITLNVTSDKHRIDLSVADHGPGIQADQLNTLFQPFSKSAEQAAVSKPGVGLGLALSSRLARQLGGKLTHDRNAKGCQFVLSLTR